MSADSSKVNTESPVRCPRGCGQVWPRPRVRCAVQPDEHGRALGHFTDQCLEVAGAEAAQQHVLAGHEPGVAGRIFSTIAEANIVVDMIVQSVSEYGTTDLSFTIHENDVEAARNLLEPIV